MLLKDHMTGSGALLFRWRSYLPMVFLPLMAITLQNGEMVELRLGDIPGEIYEGLCVLMVMAGQVLRIATVGFVPNGTSGRNTSGQIAVRLNTTGLYSVVRNPLYLGNCLMYLGVAGYTQDVMLTLVLALVLALYYERIISTEETFLAEKFGPAYLEWAAVTPAFFPRLAGWRAPDLRFSPGMVIYREHASVFAALLSFYLIELGLHFFGGEPEAFPLILHGLMGAAALVMAVIVVLKRRTRVFAASLR